MKIRLITHDDIDSVSAMLQRLVDAGLRVRPSDPDFVRENYVAHPQMIATYVALSDDHQMLGLQTLSRAEEGNPYGTPPGWGIIGTHVCPGAGRKGIGRRLFSNTVGAMRTAGLRKVEAFIQANNPLGLAYYDAMGFETYDERGTAICKVYTVR